MDAHGSRRSGQAPSASPAGGFFPPLLFLSPPGSSRYELPQILPLDLFLFPAIRTGSRQLVGLVSFGSFLFCFIFLFLFSLATNPSQSNINYIVLRPCKLLQPVCINRIYTYLSDRQKYVIFRTHSSRIRENLGSLLFACTG